MSEWRMDPASVRTVLTNTGKAYEALTGVVTEERLGVVSAGLTWGSVHTRHIRDAVAAVLNEQQQVNLRAVVSHVAAGQAGVGNAAIALQEGNQDMAASFQSEMFAAAEGGDFEYFEQHGHRG